MRLNALWWWIDRWRKSTAYTDMTLEEQGAYRNLLDEANLRGGALPNDERILAKACGDALAWDRVRQTVMVRFELREDGWHNNTLDEVMTESKRRAEKQRRYRNKDRNVTGNAAGNRGGSPYPSPSPVTYNGSTTTPPNPLAPDRAPLETECLQLVREVAEAAGRDPTEVMAEASEWKGSRGSMNPAAMSEGRLLNVVLNLRRMREGRSKEAPSPKARQRMDRLEALATGRVPGASEREGVDAGHGGAGRCLPGAGGGSRRDGSALPGVPPGDPAVRDRPPVAARGKRGDSK